MEKNLSVGDLFEIEVLGTCSNYDPDVKYEYLSFRDCVREAIELAEARGWNPKNPGEDLLITRLFQKVRQLSAEQQLRLKFKVWSSIGTRLDHLHGVDGFFEVRARRSARTSRKFAVYAFDISICHSKRFRTDIDVLNRSCFNENLDVTAQRILDGIRAKLA